MFRSSKFILTSLTVFMITTLTACNLNLGQAAAPTPTAFDINAITTNVAATVQAQLTLSAPTAVPTNTITATLPASETPAGGATVVTSIIPLEGTPSLTPFGGFTAIPSFTPILAATVVAGPVCKNAAFDGDITVPDHTQMSPWEKFDKVWAMKNTGTCRWDEGFFFAAVDGPPSMGKNLGKRGFKTPERFVEPGATTHISIHMYAPGDYKTYTAIWQMFDDSSKPFGQQVFVVIDVVNK